MLRSLSGPSVSEALDDEEQLKLIIENLLLDPEREAVGSEIEVLKSIYGDDAVHVWHPASEGSHRDVGDHNSNVIRYEVMLSLPSPHEDVSLKVLVSIPPSYPATSPPQLQLLSRYIGAFSADSNLFGSVLRTFISSNGVEWVADTVCVFDGLQNVLDRCLEWYQDRLSAEKAGALVREDARDAIPETQPRSHSPSESPVSLAPQTTSLPDGIRIYEAEPITDRKSSFVGRACAITDPSQVPMILAYLSADRRISRAAHPIINAWRCQVGGLLHQDNDDDGETAAAGRIAHLLQILEVNNVLVVVTRYFGGIHLGPDRFKHINQAARNALDLGGFLETSETKRNTSRVKRH